MLSIDNTYSGDEVRAWVLRVDKQLGDTVSQRRSGIAPRRRPSADLAKRLVDADSRLTIEGLLFPAPEAPPPPSHLSPLASRIGIEIPRPKYRPLVARAS